MKQRESIVEIKDWLGRSFSTLRVSLLSACNLGCVYCTLGEYSDKPKKNQRPAADFLDNIARLHKVLSLDTIRLTGGEPLLYHDLPALIAGIQDLGIRQIKLTTNGFMLERLALPLKEAGLQAVNVSLDAVEESVFCQMSKRRGLHRVLAGIGAAQAAGLEVKLNAVILRDLNENQILPLVRYAFSRNIRIRFLEVMAMGHLHEQADRYLVTQEEILNTLATEFTFKRVVREVSATATYWQTPMGNQFGMIANESEPFCGNCNRLRLDAQGNIYGCLSSDHPISIQPADSPEVLREKLVQALAQKQVAKFTGSSLSMLQIGG